VSTEHPFPRSATRPANTSFNVVVIGAGMTGLTAALLLARDGHQVTVLDRDPAGPPESAEAAWQDWPRPGVSQFRQLHVVLPRWRQIMADYLPEVLTELAALGGTRTNLLHLNPTSTTGGWQSGDEQFDTLTARRPVLEAALARVAQSEPGVQIRRGCSATGLDATGLVATGLLATGLLTTTGAGTVPRVTGVSTKDGAIDADLVIDAGGRHTPVPAWSAALGAAPRVEQADSGLVYYTRHYRGVDGRTPPHLRGALTHHESFSLLTLPGDNGVWAVAIMVSSRDRAVRALRHAGPWAAAVGSDPAAAPWLDAEPLTDVQPLAGLQDITRTYVVDGAPVITGLLPVGDAWAATNPSLGRGITLGALHACVLRDVLAQSSPAQPTETGQRFAAATAAQVGPLVQMTIGFGQHRLGEMNAELDGAPYRTDDPTWSMTTALMKGARHDPVLVRAHSRIASLLATPPEVMTDPAVQTRLRPHFDAPRYPADDCTRGDLLRAVRAAEARTPPQILPPPTPTPAPTAPQPQGAQHDRQPA
jgi:2-polyprenyl-6-methoxyphenol hydroxylase-like FAD-dependent oxidoreductase